MTPVPGLPGGVPLDRKPQNIPPPPHALTANDISLQGNDFEVAMDFGYIDAYGRTCQARIVVGWEMFAKVADLTGELIGRYRQQQQQE